MPPLGPFARVVKKARRFARIDKGIVSQVANLQAPDLSSEEADCVLSAVADYSKRRPRQLVKTVSVNAPGVSGILLLDDLVDGWKPGTFRVDRIGWPLTDADSERYLDGNYWKETLDPATGNAALRLLMRLDSNFALWWSEPHIFTPETSTVPEIDETLLACGAAHYICSEAASRAAVFAEQSPMSGDSVQYPTVQDRFERRADKYLKLFEAGLALSPADFSPTFVDSDELQSGDLTGTGQELIFHRSPWY